MAEHDQLFKRAFRVPEHAAAELRAVLPASLAETIDFGSLELLQSDLVSQRLNERFTDALFRAKFRGVTGYVWLLLEHQSEPDRFMPLRVLEYFARSWLDLLRREPTRKLLPPIACVVVHHGADGWNAATTLHELVEGVREIPALARLVPNFEIIVDDLATQSDDALKSRSVDTFPRVAWWVLRDARTIERFFEHLESWAADLSRLAQISPEDAVSVMRYLISVTGNESFDKLQQRIVEAAPAAEATMTTAAEQLIQRGRIEGKAEGRAEGKAEGKAEGRAEGKAEGKAEGRAEGKAEAVLAVLAARKLPVNTEQRARVLACRDSTVLERWLRLAATVGSSVELFSR